MFRACGAVDGFWPPLRGGWQREALTEGEKKPMPSLPPSRLRRDTSLTEGGETVPAGVGMTPLRGVRGDEGIAPYEKTASPYVDVTGRTESSAPTEQRKGRVRKTVGGAEPLPDNQHKGHSQNLLSLQFKYSNTRRTCYERLHP